VALLIKKRAKEKVRWSRWIVEFRKLGNMNALPKEWIINRCFMNILLPQTGKVSSDPGSPMNTSRQMQNCARAKHIRHIYALICKTKHKWQSHIERHLVIWKSMFMFLSAPLLLKVSVAQSRFYHSMEIVSWFPHKFFLNHWLFWILNCKYSLKISHFSCFKTLRALVCLRTQRSIEDLKSSNKIFRHLYIKEPGGFCSIWGIMGFKIN